MAKGGFLSGIMDAFNKAKPMLVAIGGAVLVYVILLIILGVFNNQVQTGTIAVDAATKIAINNSISQFVNTGTAIFGALNSTTGFIVIGVILVLVAGFIGLKGLTEGSSSRRRRRY